MQLSVTYPRDQVFKVIVEANAVFYRVLGRPVTSKSYGRKYSKAKKKQTNKQKGILNVKALTTVSEIN